MHDVDMFFTEILAPATSSEATRLAGLSRAVECSDWLSATLRGEDAPGDDGYALSRLLVQKSLDSYCPACPTSTSTTISPPPSGPQPHHPAVIAGWVAGAISLLWATLNVLDAFLGEIKALRKAAAGVGSKGCWGKFLTVVARVLRQMILFFL